MSNVVLVVDMLKGFLEPGCNLYHAESRDIIPNVDRLELLLGLGNLLTAESQLAGCR